MTWCFYIQSRVRLSGLHLTDEYRSRVEKERERPAHTRVSVCCVLLTVSLQSLCFPMGKCRRDRREAGAQRVHRPAVQIHACPCLPFLCLPGDKHTLTHTRKCEALPLQHHVVCLCVSVILRSTYNKVWAAEGSAAELCVVADRGIDLFKYIPFFEGKQWLI